ncbi:hypothetical protein [Thermocladium modestius]|nr:hypothetical protein [Thermocladium modestius]
MECLEETNELMEEALEAAANGGDPSSVADKLAGLPCGKPYLDLLRGGEPQINSVLATTHYAQYMRGRPSHALIELVRSGLSEAGLARYVLGRPSDAGIAVDLLFHLVMLRVTGDPIWRRRLETRLRLVIRNGDR